MTFSLRRLLAALTAALLLLPGSQARAQQLPPHAWLFGTWTGGIFPVSGTISPQACFSQPVIIFTRDVVMRATLTEPTLTQREVETARNSPQGVEFRLVPAGGAGGLLGGTAAAERGFGCESPDVLHVQRRGENEIAFPGCADFPNPLVRCR